MSQRAGRTSVVILQVGLLFRLELLQDSELAARSNIQIGMLPNWAWRTVASSPAMPHNRGAVLTGNFERCKR